MPNEKESKRHKKLREDMTELIGEERAKTLLASVVALDAAYAKDSSVKLGEILEAGRAALKKDAPTEGDSKDYDKATRMVGEYFLQELICDHLAQAATISTLARESTPEFVQHACQHHEDAKQDYLRDMFRDMLGATMERVASDGLDRAAKENSENC